ncbi:MULTISPECIES: anti-repressor SinI family protein [Thalassobacillus]|uniref:anti-repressor SinI family protein n=1 Tax=Thalassobacillus TaxID=331971 RepID=UPI00111C3775|nr:anti-repressor SinI family protein [Thalassobacillus devorans]
MAITKQVKTGGLDMEWVELMKQAKEMGMSKEEVRHFLDERRIGRTNTYGN